jgi:Domain of unknown function (DUF1905)
MSGGRAMPQKTVTVTLHLEGSTCFIPVTFDPKAVFGKVRAPVKVTLNQYSYRSTIASMGSVTCIPLRRSHREAAGLVGGEQIAATIELDVEPREVDLPAPSRLRNDRLRGRADWPVPSSLCMTVRPACTQPMVKMTQPEAHCRQQRGSSWLRFI